MRDVISHLTKELDKATCKNLSVKSLIEKASTEDLVLYAKLAEQAEHYEDMSLFLQPVADKPDIVKTENRNLLSVAYKNRIGALRNGFRVLVSIEENQKYDKELVKRYKSKFVERITDISKEAINLIENNIYKFADTVEDKVFFLKMRADYYRWSAECLTGEELKKAAEQSDSLYKQGLFLAKSLGTTNPISLGISLNYSVLKYEILKEPKEATEISKNAFDDAISKIECLDDDTYRDVTMILQLIRDNLMMWAEEQEKINCKAN